MLEGTPGQPYGSTLKDLLKVEKVRVTKTNDHLRTSLRSMNHALVFHLLGSLNGCEQGDKVIQCRLTKF